MENLIIKNFKCFRDANIPLNQLTILREQMVMGKVQQFKLYYI